MAKDPEYLAHQAWLGFVQPVGLVVSIPALLAAQAYVNRNVAPLQQVFLDVVGSTDDPATARLADFPAFAQRVLGWEPADLVGTPAGGDLPPDLSAVLPEYNETLRPTYAVRALPPIGSAATDTTVERPWLLLVSILPAGTDFDRVTSDTDPRPWKASPQHRFERLLRETHVPAGLLCNGTHLRLVYAPRGETSGHATFRVADMVTVAGRPLLAAVLMLLSADRILGIGLAKPERQRLSAILAESRRYQNEVSAKLAEQVLAALYDLLRGFQAADDVRHGDLLRDVLAASPNQVYNGLLTVLLRLVFLLYAEDRGLMSSDPMYVNHYSVVGLFDRLRADHARYPDTMDQRFGAWAQLLTLFRLVHDGGRHGAFSLQRRRGYLFDPDRYPFLEGRPLGSHYDPAVKLAVPRVSDGVVFRILSNLLVLDGERLSYRSLDVEQIGSVYETMMGFDLKVAAGRSIAIKPAKPHGAPAAVDLEALLAVKPADRAKAFKDQTDQKLTGAAADGLKSAATVDDLLAAVERKIARVATPNPVSPGAMILQPSDARRRSGSHYTPRALTGPIVRKTLEPILRRLGVESGELGVQKQTPGSPTPDSPLSTPHSSIPTPEQLLDLKVCDPAVGSGAFVVEACRQLGDELVKSWHAHGVRVTVPPDEDETLYARRLVAQRCLYGVDRNPMAVDLAKLSLWLATLAKDHPFTFLDHAIKHGDSLIGLTRDQIESFHWLPNKPPQPGFNSFRIREKLIEAQVRRDNIRHAPEAATEPELTALLRRADDATDDVRLLGDLAVLAFFDRDKPAKREQLRKELYAQAGEWIANQRPRAELTFLQRQLAAGNHSISTFHWEIEFPEVFNRNNAGFDAVVGNPPFLGGSRISSFSGEDYFEWLTTCYSPAGHQCDLVGYFFRRAFVLLRQAGTFGLLATNTISQGDTREGGLCEIVKKGGVIYDAVKRYRWPGEAAVVVSRVCLSKGPTTTAVALNERPVKRISAYLMAGSTDSSPTPLSSVPYYSLGSKIYGQGFLFDDNDPKASPISDMNRIIQEQPSSRDRIHPYFGGDELNTMPTPRPSRFVIGFSDIEEEVGLSEWPRLSQVVREKVRPEREQLGSNANNIPLKRRWWAYQAHRPELYAIAAARSRMLACSQVTAHLSFAFLPPNWTYSQKLCVVDVESFGGFAVLQSRVHEVWARFLSSTMKDDLNYSPSDCFATFPFNHAGAFNAALEECGEQYYRFRTDVMVRNDEGLTKTYNRFHDPDERSADILRLQELHAAMDRAVLDAYGWTDLRPKCEFILDYDDEADDDGEPATGRARRKPWRYRWPDEFRDTVLARLLELNQQRAAAEGCAGGNGGSTKPSPKPRKPRKPKSPATEWQLQPEPPPHPMLPGLGGEAAS
jgi:hypothetical protein